MRNSSLPNLGRSRMLALLKSITLHLTPIHCITKILILLTNCVTYFLKIHTFSFPEQQNFLRPTAIVARCMQACAGGLLFNNLSG